MPSDSLTSQGRGGYLHNLGLRFKKKTFHRIGFENGDNDPDFSEGFSVGMTSVWISVLLQVNPKVHFMVFLLNM